MLSSISPLKKHIGQLIFLLLLIVGTMLILREQHEAPYLQDEGQIFGTYYHITYQHAGDLQPSVDSVLHQVDRSLSAFNPNSTLSLINQNKSTHTDPMLRHVIQLALQVSQATQGAFDITVAPLVNAWGFGFDHTSDVAPSTLDSLMHFVGYRQILLRGNRLLKIHRETQIDLSAIAKGYACDLVADTLQRQGVTNYLVEIGGEVRMHGVNSEGKPWHIGISKPTDGSQPDPSQIAAMLTLTNTSMATSGNYRNFYIKNGRKYAHTIDPHTGRPVQHSLLSATVVAPTCAEADAYATAFMVMGVQRAQAIVRHTPRLHAYLIYTDSLGHDRVWQNITP